MHTYFLFRELLEMNQVMKAVVQVVVNTSSLVSLNILSN